MKKTSHRESILVVGPHDEIAAALYLVAEALVEGREPPDAFFNLDASQSEGRTIYGRAGMLVGRVGGSVDATEVMPLAGYIVLGPGYGRHFKELGIPLDSEKAYRHLVRKFGRSDTPASAPSNEATRVPLTHIAGPAPRSALKIADRNSVERGTVRPRPLLEKSRGHPLLSAPNSRRGSS